MNVKTVTVCCSALLFSVTLLVSSAAAQFIISVDENGSSAGSSLFPLSYSVGVDPLATGAPNFPTTTLFYSLPWSVLAGELDIMEPGGGLSDVVRFEGFRMYIYSLNDGDGALADVGLPQPVGGLPVVTVAESAGVAIWNPNIVAGDPGTPTGQQFPVVPQYIIHSDAVPEPSGIVLGAIAGSALLIMTWRRRLLANVH